MKIEVNKKFEEFVMNSFFQKNKYSLNDEFNNFDILEIDECYYFSFAAPEGKYSKDLTDRTGNEVSYNRILIEDYINLGRFVSGRFVFSRSNYVFETNRKNKKYRI